MPEIKKTVQRPWLKKRKPQEGRKHSNKKFYQSVAWRKLRAVKISQQPFCEECLKSGKYVSANVVDHIVPINQGGEPLAFDNLQSLCNRCHNKKSSSESRYEK